MGRWTERRARFRGLLENRVCTVPASVYDPMTARMARSLGYEAGILAGSTASMTVLGAPDLILLTLSELADQTARITRASDLPLLIDADHGYGNALNVMRTVEDLEAAGAAALSIEDTDLPARFGAPEETRLLPLAEGVGKIRAAMAAKPDPSLTVCARTSAATISGVAECAARVRAYTEAGADAIFLVGVPDREALDRIAAETSRPIILGSAGKGLNDPDYLVDRGVRVRLVGHQPIAAALNAAYETLAALRDGTAPADLPGLPPTDRVRTALDETGYAGALHRFLKQGSGGDGSA
jgi:carboxyvinyl-carboxyphosphonate phosphorylmutase